MPILMGRIEHIGLNCAIFIGAVSRADALGFPGRIDPTSPAFGASWISYFHDFADLSDLDASCLLELRDRLRPVVAALSAKGVFQMKLVSRSTFNDPLLAAWRSIVSNDPDYASSPRLLHDLPSAVRDLGLSETDGEQIRAWLEAQCARFLQA